MSKKKHTKRAAKQGTERLLLGLVIGIAIGFGWYFLKDRLPVQSHQPASKHKTSTQIAQSDVDHKKQPKFDFYTMLPNGKTQTPPPAEKQAVDNPRSITTAQSQVPPVQAPVNSVAQVPATVSTQAQTPITPPVKIVSQTPITSPVKTVSQTPTTDVMKSAPPIKPAPVVSTKTMTALAPVTAQAKAFIVQVGSFKNLEDADRAKAQLILEGFAVTSQQVSNNNRLFYRVFIGPYSKHQEAFRANEALAKLNYHGLILAR